MQEVSAGATDTAEHVQNQLEQTHAIQDKVDEVATAVEEIGNSMTLTLKALAEGKQDIESTWHRKLKLLLIMEPRLQKNWKI